MPASTGLARLGRIACWFRSRSPLLDEVLRFGLVPHDQKGGANQVIDVRSDELVEVGHCLVKRPLAPRRFPPALIRRCAERPRAEVSDRWEDEPSTGVLNSNEGS